MFTGTAKVCMHLQGVQTIKDKRRIVKSVIERLKSRFNVSAAEINRLDNKKIAVIGFAVVSNDRTFTTSQLETIKNFIYNDGRFFLGDVQTEIISFDGD